MPLGRRRRDERKAEARALDAARAAVDNVLGCFVSDFDDYEVRSCIAIRNDAGGVNVLHLGWDDEDVRFNYFRDGDVGAVISEVTPVSELSAAGAIAERWIGPTCREVPFNALPGFYQHVYVEALVQDVLGAGADLPLPLNPLVYSWVSPTDSDLWVVRIFPSGIGETGPPIGEVGCVLMPRAAIEEMYRLRGW
jgi:hypothetical protein